ncbi:hypothetical protein CAOG_05685 [Capsaspora owczarzaki ATCC 30864]|uniref:Methylated-DNA--protein-cysteine methyltransferase n=1 Tax=Capsaspora owczarzaki (strain ATCC 30864) TaxID=595528 RepID=A0A0D2X403_CAPO3|nr:hypothetical protein CAOG_05685 [Capsaspora owczarzaki ATCC 30864]KJE95209.1 hypothetical protein CAOG_005685 [Capsaspora owczarzaki ATCC 30864]|eukprot:XP_004346358.2 hypothetical protein CAOG_05685 [Capsaspora owczarzaki ATCC 30864]
MNSESLADTTSPAVQPASAPHLTSVPTLAIVNNPNVTDDEWMPPSVHDPTAYPTTAAARLRWAHRVSPFRFAVYDAILQVPKGRITTYGHIAKYLASAPRAVGQALRNNPFAPYVPCHRVLDSSLFVGGFSGQWGQGKRICCKKDFLQAEGVEFDETDHIPAKEQAKVLWFNFSPTGKASDHHSAQASSVAGSEDVKALKKASPRQKVAAKISIAQAIASQGKKRTHRVPRSASFDSE